MNIALFTAKITMRWATQLILIPILLNSDFSSGEFYPTWDHVDGWKISTRVKSAPHV